MAKKNKEFVLREGFFRNSEDDSTNHLPVAKEREKAWKGKKVFLEALSTVEAHAETKADKGWSTCRCCGKKNGSQEFEFEMFGMKWVWPAGYSHYVEEHNIRPGLAFQEFIIAAAEAGEAVPEKKPSKGIVRRQPKEAKVKARKAKEPEKKPAKKAKKADAKPAKKAPKKAEKKVTKKAEKKPAKKSPPRKPKAEPKKKAPAKKAATKKPAAKSKTKPKKGGKR